MGCLIAFRLCRSRVLALAVALLAFFVSQGWADCHEYYLMLVAVSTSWSVILVLVYLKACQVWSMLYDCMTIMCGYVVKSELIVCMLSC